MVKPQLNPDGVSVTGCQIIYAPQGQAGEYSKLATNPYRGCGHGCVYCVAPETLIQMIDGSAKPIKDVEIGDTLVGLVRRAKTRRTFNWNYAPSVVLDKLATTQEAFRVTLANGMTAVSS